MTTKFTSILKEFLSYSPYLKKSRLAVLAILLLFSFSRAYAQCDPALVLAGSTVCSKQDGNITITAAESSITYEVLLAGVSLSPAVTGVGTGADLVLTIPEAQMIPGTTTYTIEATGTACTAVLTDSVDVTERTGLDSDGDGIVNDCDLDDDNDGLLDTLECPSDLQVAAHTGQTDGVSPVIASLTSNAQTATVTATASGGASFATIGASELFLFYEDLSGTFTLSSDLPLMEVEFLVGGLQATNKVGNFTATMGDGTVLSDMLITIEPTLGVFTASGFSGGPLALTTGAGGLNYVTNPSTVIAQAESRLTFPALTTEYLKSKGGLTSLSLVVEDGPVPGPRAGFSMAGSICPDSDGDSIPDYLDSDSDNDGCPDALEGGALFDFPDLVGGGDDSLGDVVDGDGVPIVAGGGQADVSSTDASTIAAVCKTSCSIAGAEAQYTFEGTGTTNDVSGATVHNPTSIGTGISFSTDAIEGTNSATYDGTGGNGSGIVIDDAFFNAAFTTRTMSMFIKPTVLNIGQTLYEEGGLNNGIELRLASGGNLILFVTEGGVVRSTSIPFPTDGDWHQVGFVYDGSAGVNQAWLYLDGYPVGAVDAFDELAAHGSGASLFQQNGTSAGSTSATVDRPYTGLMDDVAVYDSALTPKNMLDIADCAIDNLLTDLVGVTCPVSAYLVQTSTGDWYGVDLITGENTLGSDNLNIGVNAIGFNELDGRIWGACRDDTNTFCERNQLIITSINADGTYTSTAVGPIAGLPVLSYTSGDVYNGVYYLGNGSYSSIYAIDADASSPTYLQVINTITLSTTFNSADFAVNPVDGFAYAVSTTGNLIRIDLSTGTVTDLGPAGAFGTGAFGAVYFDDQGFFYAANNNSGEISRIDLTTDPGTDYDETKTVLLSNGPISTANDGARCPGPLPIDFGDAPDSYGTLLEDDGPRHGNSDFNTVSSTSALTLGSNITIESDGQPDAAAGLDGNDDGITWPTLNADADYTETISLVNTTGADAYLNVWIDYNGDGDFLDAGEQITSDQVVANAATSAPLNFTVPKFAVGETSFARLRLCGGTGECNIPTGTAAIGEVEDYQVTLVDICDAANPEFTDKDGDGVGDVCDLDDDNDGILDSIEFCTKQNLVFSNITQLVGTGNVNSIQEGDIYLLPDVGMQNGISFDATYEVITVDFNGGGSPLISSSTAISYTTTDAIQDDYVIIKITFIESGTATAGSPTGTPIDLNDFTFTINDIESKFNTDLSEIGGVGNAQTSDNMPITYDNLLYAAGASTQVTVGDFINDGNEPNFTLIVTDPTFAGDPTDWVDETTTTTNVGRAEFEYNSLSSIEVLAGLTGSEGMVGRNLFLSASFCDIKDTDGDTIPDYLDLDSDNDGCTDALEGDGGFLYADLLNDTLTGGVDTDGVPLVAMGGQADVSSTDSLTQSTVCLCDAVNNPSAPDNDGDGVGDVCDLDDDNDGILDTVECTAIAPSTNLALTGTATQSSVSTGGVASRAIDGNTNGVYSALSTTHTTGETNPFWVVNLPSLSLISAVNVFNRTDCCGSRLDNFVMEILKGGAPVYTYVHSGTAEASTIITDFNVIGDAVRIRLVGVSRLLSLAEVEVMGTAYDGNNDTDDDGIFNCFDLDSDNDGIYDLVESGADPSLDANLDGTIDAMDTPATGDTDSDGLADSIETTNGADTGTPPRETTVGTPDYINLDSDGDGCSDAVEAYSDFDIDGSDGGIYNPANATTEPYTVGAGIDADGSVTAAAYTTPADFDGSSTQDYIESVFSFCLCNDPSDPDTDGDGIVNDCDLDDDNDGILDSVECPLIETNVALSGAATQSSTSNGGTADLAIDGNTNGVFSSGSVTHTDGTQDNPFWEVSFATSVISTVNVFNRTDCCGSRLDNFVMEILDQGAVVYTYTHGSAGASINIPVSNVIGDQVRIRLVGSSKILSLAEVQVIALELSEPDTDTDGDGIADCLDLDSDNDGCPDALEGDGGFLYADLLNDTLTGGVDTDGVPLVAAGGQADVSSTDPNVQADECDPCNPLSTQFTDKDGDGIGDICDLDDDNDGILDVDECVSLGDQLTNSGYDNLTGLNNGNNVGADISPWVLTSGQANVVKVDGAGGFDYGFYGPEFDARGGAGQYLDMAGVIGDFYQAITLPFGGLITYSGYFSSRENITGLGGLRIHSGVGTGGTIVSTTGTISIQNNSSWTFVEESVVVPAGTYSFVVFMDDYMNFDEGSLATFDCTLDTDGDGTPNFCDLDSDDDGCPDALEGDGGFLYADLLNDTLTGGVDTNGVPLVAMGGQADVSSTDSLTQSTVCLCDAVNNPSAPDNDGDGVGDVCDLDDDNDGLLDTLECPATVTINTLDLTTIGTASQISTFAAGYEALKAIDGNLNTVSITNASSSAAWWQIDLGAIYNLNEIRIFPRTSYEVDISASYVLASENPFVGNSLTSARANATFEYQMVTNATGIVQIDVDAMATSARYIRIQRAGPNISNRLYLEIDEVQVDEETYSFPDSDNDGITDCLDSDSDNDGCPDALEGDGGFIYTDLENDTLSGGVDADGIPLVAAGGQADVSSTDSLTQSTVCLCDAVNNPSAPDNDGDGVGDVCDLDDDNDGILDTDEQCSGTTNILLDLATLNSGNDITTFPFTATDVNGIPGLDITIDFTGLSASTSPLVDVNGFANAFSYSQASTGNAFTVSFNGTVKPVGVSVGSSNNFFSRNNSAGTSRITERTRINVTNLGAASSTAAMRAGLDAAQAIVSGNGTTFHTYLMPLGSAPADGSVRTFDSNGFDSDFTDTEGFTAISILYDRPQNTSNAASTFALQNFNVNINVLCYLDTDGDGTPDYQDLDSDNDGCPDADEAYTDTTADNDDGGIYGSDTPLPTTTNGLVNNNGLVISAGLVDIGTAGSDDDEAYTTTPATTTGGQNTFQQAVELATTAPADDAACVDGTAEFKSTLTVTATPATTPATVIGDIPIVAPETTTDQINYVWQVSTDGGTTFTDITAAGTAPAYADFTGTATTGTEVTLGLSNVPLSADDYQYQVVITHEANICPVESLPATLTVNENPVATTNNVAVCKGVTSATLTVTATTGTPTSYTIDYDIAAETAGFSDVSTAATLTGASYAVPSAPTAGIYNGVLTYIDANGCSGTDAFTVTVNENPVATTNNVVVCKGVTSATLTVTATTGTPTSYTIDYDTAAETAGFSDVSTAATLTGASYAVPSAPTAGIYNGVLTYIDANGCSGTDAFTVTVNENPVATTNNVAVCKGVTSATLTVTATTGTPTSYTIDYDTAAETAGFSDVSTAATLTGASYAVPSAPTAGIYNGTLTYIDANGCSGTDAFTVTVNENPVATTNNVAVCKGVTSATLTVTATTGTPTSYTIDYDIAAETAGFSDVSTAATLTGASYAVPSAPTAGIYNGVLTYIDANGCSGTDAFTVTVNENPVATTNNVVVCKGVTSATLTVTATTGTPTSYTIDYDIAAETAGFSDVSTAATLTGASYAVPSAPTAGIYNGTLTYIDVNGCSGTDAFTVTVNENPVATTNNVAVCKGVTSATLTVTATTGTPTSYTIDYDIAAETAGFSDVSTAATLTGASYAVPSAPTAGIYNGTLTYIDANGCSGTDAFTVTVNENPVATTNNVAVCKGVTSATLTVTATTGTPTSYTIDYDIAAETAGFSDVSTAATLTGASYAVPSAPTAGIYNGVLTYIDANGCSGTDAFTVTVNENPVATTNNVAVCKGVTSATIAVTATTGTPINYTIDYDAAAEAEGFADVSTAATITGASYVIPAAAAAAVYNGTLSYIDANGCSGTDAFTVTVNENPVATTNNVAVCKGVTSATIAVTATTGTPINYTIDYDAAAEAEGFADVTTAATLTGASYVIPAAAAAAVYNGTLSYIDANGCSGTDAFTVTVNENPVATTNNVTVCKGVTSATIAVTATTGTPINYTIDYDAAAEAEGFADVTTAATLTGASYVIPAAAAAAVYNGTLSYIDANGCSGTDAFTVTVNENPVATTNNVAVCKGVTSATIAVTATTGTPINYTIDYDAAAEIAGFADVTTAATLTGASYAVPSAPTAGTYNGTLTYIDANGCSGTDAFTVTVKPVPILALTSATNPTNCTPGNNGKIVLSTTDLPDGSYTINYEDASAVAQTTTMVVVSNVGTISNLTVGTYNNIKVTNLSCTSVADIDVVLKCVEIDLVKTVSTAPTDNGDGTFTVGYTVTATNSGSVAGVYDIVEDFNPGTGITFTSGTLAYGAEADGTNGTTAAVADGATIVDNEGLSSGATESWTITAIFTVDPTAITAAGSDCDTTNDGGAGTGFANSISGSSTDTDVTDNSACAALPIIDLVKTVSTAPTDNGDGTFTVGYTVTATNSGSVAGVYDIVEDFNPGTGITFTSGTLAYGAEADGTNGTTAAVADGATIVDNEGLAAGATESWTITAIFTVDPTAITAAGSDCDTTNDGGAGTGFANSISGSSTDTDTTDNSACAALPIIDLVKTVSGGPTDNGDGTFTVGYTVTATNSGSVAGVYDIVEDFNPGTGITFTSGTLAYGAEADGTNGTTAAVADGATIVDNEGLSAGATESWTITAIFTVDPTAITAAGSDCDTTNDGGAGTGFANSISGSSTDTDTTDNSACAALPIIDLVKTVSTAPTDNGDGTFTVGYTVTATNSGSVAGMYDIVEDFNPGTGITFTSGTLAYGAEADGTNGTTAAVADGATIVDNEGLAAGATESWTITAIFTVDPTAITAAGSDCDTTNDGGAGTGFANSISGSSTDTDTTDDVACAGLPIIDLVKTVSGGPTDNGDGTFTVGYTVTATNSGSVAGVYDIVEDFNPGTGITFTSGTLAYGAEADGTNGTTAAVADGATIVDNEGLAAGATESWTITAIFTVDPTAITAAGSDCDTTNDGGAGTGFANSISGSSTDTDTTDNSACAALPIIDLVKTVSGGPTDNGDGTFTVGYTVTATNSGSVAGVYDIIEDFNPGTGITFTSGTLAYGAEADGTNGTTAAVADGATIVDNEGLAAGATESWTITAIFTVDPTAITAAGSDCDTTNDGGAGTGFANSISGSSTDTDTTDDVACAGLPIIDLVKTVSTAPTDNGDGTFTVGYTVTATNSGSVAGVYDIVEDFNPGTGITFTSGTLAYGAEADGTNGTTAAVADGATIVDNEGLAAGATESWTITAIFTVDPTAITAAGSDCDTTNDGGAGTGFANSISGSSTDTDTTDDVACAGLPIIDLVKTVSTAPTDNGDGTFTVGYTVTATNSGSVAGVYDIVEDFNPGTGITFTSGTLAYGAEADGTNGTTAAVADGATIVDNEGLAAGATESWTITAIFTVDPTAITAAGSDCDTTNDGGAGTGFANSISGSSTDTDTTDNSACAALPIIDLVKTVSGGPTDNGDGTFTVGYTVTATNSGSVAGMYDIVEDFNPGTGITFTSGTLAYGAEADGTNGTTAAVADGATIVDNEGLAAGATESWTITAIFTVDPTAITAAGSDCDTTNDGGAGTGFANSISGSSTDTDTTDDVACAGLPIIDLVKTVSGGPTDNGDGTFTVGYTVTATNSGSVAGVYDIVEDFNPGTGITFTSGTLAYGAEADGTNGTTAAVADGATIVDNEGLAAGATESWTITAIFTVDPTAITAAGSDCDTTNDGGAGTGFANSISGSSTDTDTTDNSACAGLPIIDLVKTVSGGPTDNGDGTFTVGYTVTATNSGSVAGVYDIVEDFNPGTGITFTSGTLAYGAEADGTNGTTAAVADGATIVDNEGLSAGATESWTITAIFTVDPTAITAAGSDCDTTNDSGAGTGFANSISGSSTDTDTTDDVACAGLPIIDLVKTVSTAPTDNGDGTFTVGYTVTATNSGSVAGVYDIVEDFNPGTGITFTSGTLAYGAEADGTNGTTAAVADGATIVDNEGLSSGATESWTITAIFTVDPTAITAAGSDCDTTNDGGAGTGFANSISGSSTDTDVTDNSACAGLPIIDLVKTVSTAPTDNGDGTFTVGYTVTATNSGSVAGMYDIVEDFNPGTGITFTSGTLAYGAEADGTNGTTAAVADGATIVDNEGLSSGATESWTITAIFTVDPTAITAAGSDCDTTNDGGAGTGFANSISGSSTDTDTTDDSACAALPIIDLVKTVSGGPTDNGDGTFTVGYTVTATNSGSVAGVYDIVEDFNPGTGITFTSGTLAYGAEADGTNGTTAAVADGATIVDNEGLAAGATESWTITAIFTVDPTAITAAGSDCDTTNDGGAGTGFANSISGSSTDTDTTDDVACAGLPIIDLVKTVSGGPTDNGDGTFTVGYTVTATNSGSVAGVYDIVEDFNPGTGITFTSGTLAYGAEADGTNGTTAAVADGATIVDNEGLAAGATESWTITAIFTVDPTAITAAGSDCDTTNDGGAGTGFANSISGSSTDTDTTDNSACAALPIIDLVKTVSGGPTDNGDGTFTVGYTVTATNSGSVAGVYDIVEDFNPGTGITFTSGTLAYGAEADGTNGTTAAVADGATIVDNEGLAAGATESWTITAIFTVDPTAITAAGSDCDTTNDGGAGTGFANSISGSSTDTDTTDNSACAGLPIIDLVKTVSGGPTDNGDGTFTVGYTVTATNSGSVAGMYDIVEDFNPGTGITFTSGTLAYGAEADGTNGTTAAVADGATIVDNEGLAAGATESWTITAIFTVDPTAITAAGSDCDTTNDGGAGTGFANSISGSSTDTDTTDDVACAALLLPSIAITKEGAYVDGNGDGITNIGDRITYTFTVKNTGNVILTDITVTDPDAAMSGGPLASLAVGATDTTTFTGAHTLSQADIDSGNVYNLATATGTPPSGPDVTDESEDPTPCASCPIDPACTDCTITPLAQNPSIGLLKTSSIADTNADGIVGNLGDTIIYVFTIENTGNVTLSGVTISDPLPNIMFNGGPIASLAPGAIDTTTFTASYVITQADIDAGEVFNQATVSGEVPGGDPADPTDDITDTSDDPNDPTDDDGDPTDPTDDDGEPDDPTVTPLLAQDPCAVSGPIDEADLLNLIFANADCDGDGVTNGEEIDPDGDGRPGGTGPEGELSTNWNDPCDYNEDDITLLQTSGWSLADCDGDGTPNGEELPGEEFDSCKDDGTTGDEDLSSPIFANSDCDGDGVTNGTEITDGTDPSDPCDFVADSVSLEPSGEFLTSDCDRDRIPNGQEITEGTDMFDPCSGFGGTPPNGVVCDIEIVNELITPDGDGVNDVFRIRYIESYPVNSVEIFNRWGVKVFTAEGYDNDTNAFRGISNGRVTVKQDEGLPAGVYFFIINYKDEGNTKSKSGYLYINQ